MNTGLFMNLSLVKALVRLLDRAEARLHRANSSGVGLDEDARRGPQMCGGDECQAPESTEECRSSDGSGSTRPRHREVLQETP